jgi:hypothetical protein
VDFGGGKLLTAFFRGFMEIGQIVRNFLEKHKAASEIIMNPQSGLPVSAIYSGVDWTGNYRTQPTIFLFSSELELYEIHDRY